MKTETLKITLAQRILSISDNALLEKLNTYLNKESIIGYNADGTPINEKDYLEDMKAINEKIDRGEFKGETSNEVKKFIIDENSLEG
ncbi:hypothetical protein SAMN05444483_11947 [Salegentibacter echinorum]|uniref:Uncharacterized protein n=1 Tax=Salegentibacter echinorum TaxID=1073325 RepID=A0A1M5LEQ8_SALEC|nr:hypothetical protein [Salegentibacter echinorum]SHG63446.1 hypothetical protein SAMN05444483_11947 [Salegentibacter echinorum]